MPELVEAPMVIRGYGLGLAEGEVARVAESGSGKTSTLGILVVSEV